MPIYSESYRNWNGRLKENPLTLWVIGKTGIRLLWKKGMIFLILLSFIPFFIKAVQIYLVTKVGDSSNLINAIGGFKINSDFFAGFIKGQMFYLILIITLAGAGLIVNDRKYKALSIYFSKPVKFWDYMGGKFLIISFYGFIVTLVPGLILFCMKVLLEKDMSFLKTFYWVPLSMIAYFIIALVVLGGLILTLSSTARSTGSAAVIFFVILIFPEILRSILSRVPEIGIFSIQTCLKQVNSVIFGQTAPYDFSIFYGVLMLAAVIMLSIIILKKKIKPTEVIA